MNGMPWGDAGFLVTMSLVLVGVAIPAFAASEEDDWVKIRTPEGNLAF